MATGGNTISKTFVWILLGLLIVGLAGFGAVNLTGNLRQVATVGNQIISVNDYARELQREIRGFEAQTGQALQMSQVTALGIDRAVLARLVSLAALDHEAKQIGLSIGDENLQREIIQIPSFQGIDGKFDREGYRFALESAGINEAEFEADMRAESARTLLQGAIIAGVEMPAEMSETLTNYITARRTFTLARLGADTLPEPPAEPSDADLQAYYDENPEEFTLPETKRLTYVLLSPEMMLDQVELDDAALRQLYEDRSAFYNQPERRLVERLVFPNAAAARDAMAQLEVNGTTFEALVQGRGLSLADTDLGDVTVSDLDQAGEAVFAAEIGTVVGPLESGLGPALYRVNGSLAARSTSFEDARAELHEELAAERARRLVEAQAENIDDLLAGGATLEELGDETDMQLARIDWDRTIRDGIAAYDAFRTAAGAITDEDFPQVVFLADGGLFAMRLDETLAPRPKPFEDAREQVIAGWLRQQTELALQVRAEQVVNKIVTGGFGAAGVSFRTENGLTRTAYLEGTPADFMTQVFEMDKGELRVITGDQEVYIVRLDEELPPEDTEDLAAMRAGFERELSQNLSQALFQAFIRDVQLRARPNVDQQALNAVQASFQ